MTKHFLITRPNYDKETAYVYSFSKSIVSIAIEMRDVHVTDLQEAKATRNNFEKTMKKFHPKLVFLNGHGDESSVWGHNDEPIL